MPSGPASPSSVQDELLSLRGVVEAIHRSQAVIEFAPDGTVLEANENFLQTMGYSLAEVRGRHHRMFCEPELADGDEYAAFWATLARGEFESGVYKRLTKDGRTVWLRATYNPILDENGKPVRVVKLATDITEAMLASAERQGQALAIDRSQAVIEFAVDGTVLTANRNFLDAMGYTLAEVRGKHHRMFCEPGLAASDEYADFWRRLGEGQFEGGVYKRLAKGGREVWLQATYNPILDDAGTPLKIVKLASDITLAKLADAEFRGKVAAIDRAQAVIEFKVDGTVLSANQNFLDVMGYGLHEIQGKHHRMFCEPALAASEEYEDFWARLGSGAFEAGEYKRVAKGGKEVWLQATYNPILDDAGKPMKIVKFATDITERRVSPVRTSAARWRRSTGRRRSIEFDLNGRVLSANQNFLESWATRWPRSVGQHHRMFCEPGYAASEEYAQFWERLGRRAVLLRRVPASCKDGNEVWLQATYNPILDDSGTPC